MMMKETVFVAVALSLIACACAPRMAPRDRYIAALNHRLDGNPEASFDEMIALAHEAPDSRAGRRARATLQGGGMMSGVAIVGILAAIAVPNYRKFQTRTKQSEAKSSLESLYVAQLAFHAETGRYCKTFEECGWEPPPDGRYIYLLGNEALGGDESSLPLLRMRASAILAELGIESRVHRNGFLLIAVGNIDGDDRLDVWTIDEKSDLRNRNSDVD